MISWNLEIALLMVVLLAPWRCGSFKLYKFMKDSCHRSFVSNGAYPINHENSLNQQAPVIRSEIPSRFDTCVVIVTGIVGVEPKETYLKNGHYVMNFPIAVVGHFGAVHEWERFKPTETMWLPSEVWDGVAKANALALRKGSKIRSVGTLLSNKWTDKSTGEERKQFKFRISKLLTEEEFSDLSNILEINFDLTTPSMSNNYSLDTQVVESNFASITPEIENQVDPGYYYADRAVSNNYGGGTRPYRSPSTSSQTNPINKEPEYQQSSDVLGSDDFWVSP